jgi:hypothetical protein
MSAHTGAPMRNQEGATGRWPLFLSSIPLSIHGGAERSYWRALQTRAIHRKARWSTPPPSRTSFQQPQRLIGPCFPLFFIRTRSMGLSLCTVLNLMTLYAG